MKPIKQLWLILTHGKRVADTLQKHTFSIDNPSGFELIKVSPDKVHAKFFERLEIFEEVDTPFGDVQKIHIVRYVVIEFTVIKVGEGLSLIKILRPPVSIKSFSKKLMEAFEYEGALKKASFNLAEVYSLIQGEPAIDRLVVTKVTASQVPVGDRATARIEVASITNALLELQKEYDSPSVKLEKIMISARMNFELEILDVSAAGSIYCTPGMEFYLERTLF
ncbi:MULTISPECIES: hypothetical protein [Pseudomonas]|uniref:Uncharacterized protein n=1 Tax=Pseudomonas paralactis TaxID=1615673 RepID=A0A0R3AGP4_9PSED|nr:MULTISPECIES: hypothetical protein [Pseudomonas]KRP72058.1 hypothetical protein TX23_11900 [Pseudomonas paralactis]